MAAFFAVRPTVREPRSRRVDAGSLRPLRPRAPPLRSDHSARRRVAPQTSAEIPRANISAATPMRRSS
ncbi:MAG: hypothetical protein R3A79_25550 [Nannocystaceae bacterium]